MLLQLQGLIKKYDTTVGSKIRENIELQKIFLEEKQKFEEFMLKYDQEEEEYNRIVIQRREEIQREREAKQMLFMLNRAARIIQNYWRKYIKRKRQAEKASSKKKTKKKQNKQ